MAESLYGPCWELQCPDCQFQYRCDRDSHPDLDSPTCPNCGFRHVDGTLHQATNPGQQVSIRPSKWQDDTPKRWTPIVFRSADDGRMTVKRLVGLPGEQVSIRGGDLFINDQIERKSLAQLRGLAVLVHDNNYLPQVANDLPPRWRAAEGGTNWNSTNSELRFDGRENSWITYHHWPCVASPGPRVREAQISDSYGYNQGLSRPLNFTVDLLLTCHIELDTPGSFRLRLHDGYVNWVAEVNSQSNVFRLLKDDVEVVSQNSSQQLPVAFDVQWLHCDRRITLALNGKAVLGHDCSTSDTPTKPIKRALEIGGQNAPLTVRNLKIWRDIYYLHPHGTSQSWRLPKPLGQKELFVLGDNSPISIDSRQFSRPLTTNDFLGEVISLDRSIRASNGP